MALGGCAKCIKYLLFAFNLLFWLAGCAVLGLGLWIRFEPSFHQYVDVSYLYTASYVLIGLGAGMMVVCFFGCCGSYKESQCMLISFFMFMLLIFLGIIVLCALGYFKRDEVKEVIDDTINQGVENYYFEAQPWAAAMMDALQRNFKCCGGNRASADYSNSGRGIPQTCELVYLANPCTTAFYMFLEENFLIVVGVAAGVCGVLLLGMIFACCLCFHVRREFTHDAYYYEDKYEH